MSLAAAVRIPLYLARSPLRRTAAAAVEHPPCWCRDQRQYVSSGPKFHSRWDRCFKCSQARKELPTHPAKIAGSLTVLTAVSSSPYPTTAAAPPLNSPGIAVDLVSCRS